MPKNMTAKLAPNNWIVCPKPNPQARLRLFCFPCAGGLASAYNTWANCLPAEVEVCSVQLPGRGNRLAEPAFTRVIPLVQALTHILQPYLNVPFAFFGHSMGATLGFEIARQLRRQQHPGPLQLFACSCPAPQTPRSLPIHTLPEDAFLAALHHRYNAIPQQILENREILQLFLPSLRADFAMIDTYTYYDEEVLACPISVFGGLQDNAVSAIALANWHNQTFSSFTLQMFPGEHFFLHKAKLSFLQRLSQHLAILVSTPSVS